MEFCMALELYLIYRKGKVGCRGGSWSHESGISSLHNGLMWTVERLNFTWCNIVCENCI
jgi:hypothetical protein